MTCIADTGTKTVDINSYFNAKTSIKRLQFGVDKCYQIHVGSKEHTTPELYIDNWEVKKTNGEWKDVYTGKVQMERRDAEVYLGDIICKDGKNIKNIGARKAKGLGIIRQILDILEGTCLGKYEIEAALILRSSLLLNGFLTNSEVWYGLKSEDLKQLEQTDEILLRKILETPSSTPKCMLYLETGFKPISFIVQARRLTYLQYILKEEENSLISKFFNAQNSQSVKNDWALTVKKDLEELDINLSFKDIRRKSRHAFKALVSKATTKRALTFLMEGKNKLSKVSHIAICELTIQKYSLPHVKNVQMAKFIFQARSRMLDVKANFGKKLPCPVCQNPNTTDTQRHLLACEKLCDNVMVLGGHVPVYEDLFSKEVKKVIRIGLILSQHFDRRKQILKYTAKQSR